MPRAPRPPLRPAGGRGPCRRRARAAPRHRDGDGLRWRPPLPNLILSRARKGPPGSGREVAAACRGAERAHPAAGTAARVVECGRRTTPIISGATGAWVTPTRRRTAAGAAAVRSQGSHKRRNGRRLMDAARGRSIPRTRAMACPCPGQDRPTATGPACRAPKLFSVPSRRPPKAADSLGRISRFRRGFLYPAKERHHLTENRFFVDQANLRRCSP